VLLAILNGATFFVGLADHLSKGERKAVDISSVGTKITRVTLMWGDRNGIGRYM
jgi:hypothetical protein